MRMRSIPGESQEQQRAAELEVVNGALNTKRRVVVSAEIALSSLARVWNQSIASLVARGSERVSLSRREDLARSSIAAIATERISYTDARRLALDARDAMCEHVRRDADARFAERAPRRCTERVTA